MTDGMLKALYVGALVTVVVGTISLTSWLDAHVDPRILMKVAMVIATPIFWMLTVFFYLFWDYWRTEVSTLWARVMVYMLAAIGIAVVFAFHVSAALTLFGKLPEYRPTEPVPEPEGPVVAAIGAFAVVVSLIYLYLVASKPKSYWAERFLDMRIFAIWFVGGLYFLVASKVFDPLIGKTLGQSVAGRLGDLIGDDPKYSLLVGVVAVALATAITLWSSFRKR